MQIIRDVVEILEQSKPIEINGVTYAEPTIMSECCDNIPFVEIPTYQVKNFDTDEVLYLVVNENKVAASQFDIPGLKCAVCKVYNPKNNSNYYCCSGVNITSKNKNQYLKELINYCNIKEKR